MIINWERFLNEKFNREIRKLPLHFCKLHFICSSNVDDDCLIGGYGATLDKNQFFSQLSSLSRRMLNFIPIHHYIGWAP
ncbi:hypothetical protein T4D_12276 [Trichinella pseudospiralis]|uniref:Uncharacterized protein n=1 Tax=Trichinella pseudospiralis TaxID=6337 RepID=A0A0V1FEX3_TRIPS|nr:hypothetical protein T4D_12276 [Trichinella pseudospiralis]